MKKILLYALAAVVITGFQQHLFAQNESAGRGNTPLSGKGGSSNYVIAPDRMTNMDLVKRLDDKKTTVPYVKIVIDNLTYPGGGVCYGDVTFYFYADAAGTIPQSVSNLTVYYQITRNYCYREPVAFPESQLVASGTSYFLGNVKLVSTGSNFNCYSLEYDLLPSPDYTIL